MSSMQMCIKQSLDAAMGRLCSAAASSSRVATLDSLLQHAGTAGRTCLGRLGAFSRRDSRDSSGAVCMTSHTFSWVAEMHKLLCQDVELLLASVGHCLAFQSNGCVQHLACTGINPHVHSCTGKRQH